MFYKLKLHKMKVNISETKSNLIKIKSPRFMEETALQMDFSNFCTRTK